MHVDGITEVSTIAKLVGLPLADVASCFDVLVQLGLVNLTVPPPADAFSSGVFLALPARDDEEEP
jgi:hypothetical protein